jgi:hypothetical protein
MKLSALLAQLPPAADPEILILLEDGSMARARRIRRVDAAASGDPVLPILAASPDAIILTAANED